MACHCTTCAGKGYVTEATERGTLLTELCWTCGGTGAWDEIDTDFGSPLAKALVEAATRRAEAGK